MSNQSSLLQRSYSEEDLEKLKHLMSFRTYEFSKEDEPFSRDYSNNKGRLQRQEAYQAFKTKLNEMCDE
jgi:hypothetical protein